MWNSLCILRILRFDLYCLSFKGLSLFCFVGLVYLKSLIFRWAVNFIIASQPLTRTIFEWMSSLRGKFVKVSNYDLFEKKFPFQVLQIICKCQTYVLETLLEGHIPKERIIRKLIFWILYVHHIVTIVTLCTYNHQAISSVTKHCQDVKQLINVCFDLWDLAFLYTHSLDSLGFDTFRLSHCHKLLEF